SDSRACRQGIDARKRGLIAAVDEDQPTGAVEGQRADLRRAQASGRRRRRLERALLDGRDAGVLPILVSRRRKPQLIAAIARSSSPVAVGCGRRRGAYVFVVLMGIR